ncbi:MAG: glycosyltransferase family 2 protein [Ilumatobacteraceae bacterium]
MTEVGTSSPPVDGADPVLSVVLPCLNEAETVARCVTRALEAMAQLRISGEVVVADNGSHDGSQELAVAAGARVVDVPVRGYGAALRHGIASARGTWVVMADADDSYALENLGPFVEALRGGADLVMGNRFAGGVEDGAMPFLHRYLGNPVLSLIGRRLFRSRIRDFHCGMRAMRRDAILGLDLRADGMEFASEMVVRSELAGLSIAEVPTTLRRDGRSRPPHLRTWSDGWRHLRFLLLFSPRWLYLYPGAVLVVLGSIAMAVLVTGPRRIAGVEFDVHSLLFSGVAVSVGVQFLAFAVLAKVAAIRLGVLPEDLRLVRALERLTLERGIVIGLGLALAGLIVLVGQVIGWGAGGFGELEVTSSIRWSILAGTTITIGVQFILVSFLIGVLRLNEVAD